MDVQRRAVESRGERLLDEAEMPVGVLSAHDDADGLDAGGNGYGAGHARVLIVGGPEVPGPARQALAGA